MNELDSRIPTFKEKIGFDDVVEAEGPNSGVVFDWSELETLIFNFDQGWILDSRNIWHWDSGVHGKWYFKRGEETIVLQIFVSSLGLEPARQLLVKIASMTSMPDIPYQKSTRSLGTLSVNVPRAEQGDYIWFFHNVCFNAETDAHIDIYAFADWIQSMAEEGVVEDLSSHLPQIKSVEVDDVIAGDAAPTIDMGETFSVRAILEADEAPDLTCYSFKFLYDNKTLKWKGGKANVAKLSARCPGDVEITVQVIDRKTLLSNWKTVKVTAKE